MKKTVKTKVKALDDTCAGLREAQRGDFASDAAVAATIAKYTKRRQGPSWSSGPPASGPLMSARDARGPEDFRLARRGR